MVQEAIDENRELFLGRTTRNELTARAATAEDRRRVELDERRRQIRELGELDEEENRRLKTAFRTSRGIRAFRRSGEGASAASLGSFSNSARGGSRRASNPRVGI